MKGEAPGDRVTDRRREVGAYELTVLFTAATASS